MTDYIGVFVMIMQVGFSWQVGYPRVQGGGPSSGR